jgi:hypothetical protein
MSADITVPDGGRRTDVWGSERVAVVTYTGPASYPNTGATVGDPISGSDVGLKGILGVLTGVAFDPTGGAYRIVVYDPVLETMRWFVSTTGVEVANTQNLSAYSGIFVFLS